MLAYADEQHHLRTSSEFRSLWSLAVATLFLEESIGEQLRLLDPRRRERVQVHTVFSTEDLPRRGIQPLQFRVVVFFHISPMLCVCQR
jgi:hypothetical protein